MINLISKKNVRLIKMFLVSDRLEQIILLMSISIFFAIEFTNDLFTISSYDLESYFLKEKLLSSFKSIQSIDDWYNWIQNEFALSVLNDDVSQIKSGEKYIFGAPRIFNFYLEYPSVCLDYVLNTNFNYQALCYPQTQNDLQNLLINQIPKPSDSTLCINPNCSEFTVNQQSQIHVLIPHIQNPVKMNVFTVEIKASSRDKFKQIIQDQLANSGWISDTNSRIFGIEFTVIYPGSQDIRTYQFVLENFLGIYFSNLRTISASKYVGLEVYLNVMLSFYLITTFFNQLKTIIECNYIYKPRYILIQIGIIIELCYTILYFLESQEYFKTFTNNHAFDGSHVQNSSFVNVNSFVDIADLKTFFVSLNFIFVPFKLFNLFSWLKNAQYFVKFANVIFRSMYGLIRLCVVLATLYLCWMVAIFLGLKSYNPDFDTLFKALVSFITYEPSQILLNQRVQYSVSLKSIYFIYTLMLQLMKQILYILIVAVVLNGLQQSQDFEFNYRDPFQNQVVEQVGEVCRKLDKFEKQTLSVIKGKQKLVNEKIIIWLKTPHDYVISERQAYLNEKIKKSILKKQIKLIEFYTIQEVREFLEYLFKLKPNLLYQSSHYFRILLDFNFKLPNNNQEGNQGQNDLKANKNKNKRHNFQSELDEFDIADLMAKHILQFENFLKVLKDKGSSIPVLFNCLSSISINDKARLIKLYNHQFFTNDYFEIKNFTSLKPLNYKNQKQTILLEQKDNQNQDKTQKNNQNILAEGNPTDVTESENFEDYYNEAESQINDIYVEDDSYNEEGLLNVDQYSQNMFQQYNYND
ncbi:transmembrane protein, putative (macronuclear) [Tetrahymena thermophila SB210]|uniref:Transmembrane protein, putative n=1 Tax=Tetrahymena thermophila (strain SB210) TaxID=312017 RepID=I7LWA4_TETTS|nr:transmembrane protein, putative [Tetrahymena thermophila SB210]EAS01259.2 transmembrane protein, putative [Tetrahymena thermophila SB210]|eukprot:XP_001021504.2 transmembrane protein, putative [Tetrahymena thermophila SB210]